MTTLDHQARTSVAELPLVPMAHQPHGALDFVATFSGFRDDTGFRFKEQGDLLRIVPALSRTVGHLARLFVDDWSAEVVFVMSPGLVRDFYRLPPDAVDHEMPKKWLRFVMGAKSPFMLKGREHALARHAIVPELTVTAVERFRECSVEVLDRMIDELPLGAPVQLQDFFARFAQEMILRVTFGLDDGPELEEYRHWLNRAMRHATDNEARLVSYMAAAATVLRKPGRDELPWYTPGGRQIRRQTDSLIQRKIDQFRIAPNDSIASRLVARSGEDPFWTDKVLRDTIATLLVAGHDTSVSAYSWATDYLLHNAHAKDALCAEANAGQTDCYARAANLEALRLKAPVWGMQGLTLRDVELGGYRIRKRTWIFAITTPIHYDADLYPDPAAYRPERFLDRTPDRHGFLAFSAGKHRCPGTAFYFTEAGILLHRLFGRLQMQPQSPAIQKTYMAFGFFNRPKDGVEVMVRSRRPAEEVPVYRPAGPAEAGAVNLHHALLGEGEEALFDPVGGGSRCPLAHYAGKN